MLYRVLFSNNLSPQEAVMYFLISIFVFFISLTLHEFAHGYAAYKMGDLTPKVSGRLTLNPVKHLDMTGFVCFLLMGVGWAKPVPVNPLNFKKYKKGMRIVSLAGILTNFLLGLFAAGIYAIMLATVQVETAVITCVYVILEYFMVVNSCLTLFNILPIMPLDGYNFIATFLKPDNKFVRFSEKNGFKVLLVIMIICIFVELFFGLDLFGMYLSLIHNFVYIPIALLGG